MKALVSQESAERTKSDDEIIKLLKDSLYSLE